MTTAKTIPVPEAPPIPGLALRGYGGEADLPAIVAVMNANTIADGSSERQTVESLAEGYAQPVRWDPQADVLLAELDGRLIAYANQSWREDENGDCLHFIRLYVLPEWRGRGLEPALQSHMERRARAVAAVTGAPGARHLFACMAADTWTARTEMLLGRGYTVVRHFFDMERPLDGDLPGAPLPAGLELRPALPEHYRAIWQADLEAFRDHWGAAARTEADFRDWLRQPRFDPGLWLVAWAGDEVAGASVNSVEQGPDDTRGPWGWVDELFVRRPWRKQGLGRALLVGSLRRFKDRGLAVAGLGVDAENLTGALRLYESVGFRVYRSLAAYRKPLTPGAT